jgi:hypothetical protein
MPTMARAVARRSRCRSTGSPKTAASDPTRSRTAAAFVVALTHTSGSRSPSRTTSASSAGTAPAKKA